MVREDTQEYTADSHLWVHNGITNGLATDSREFVRVRASSREFARVRESSRESSREFARVCESSVFANDMPYARTDIGFTTIYGLRRIPARIDADSRTDSQWVHKGSYPMFTVHRAVNPGSMAFDIYIR